MGKGENEAGTPFAYGNQIAKAGVKHRSAATGRYRGLRLRYRRGMISTRLSCRSGTSAELVAKSYPDLCRNGIEARIKSRAITCLNTSNIVFLKSTDWDVMQRDNCIVA